MRKTLLLLFLLGYVAVYGQDRDLDPKQFLTKADSLSDEVVIDLRTPDEVKTGIIPGAIIIDYFGKSFEKQIASLDKSKTYLLYCASGARSEDTLKLMRKKGLVNIYHLSGGFAQWKKEGLPVETPKE